MIFDLFRNAFRNLRHKKGRSILTISSVAIGAAAVIVIGSIGECGTAVLSTELDNMGMGGFTIAVDSETNSTGKLLSEDLTLVKNETDVQDASPILVYNGNVSHRDVEEDVLLWGVDETADDIVSIQPLYGRTLSKFDIQSQNQVCLVDAEIAKAFYFRDNIVGKTIYLNCMGTQQAFEVIGIVKTGGGLLQNLIGNYVPSFVYVPVSTLQALTQRNDFDRIAVKATENADPVQAGSLISQKLDRKSQTTHGYIITNLSNQRDQLLNILEMVTLVLIVIGAISLLVSGLGIMTVMLVSVSERTKEIGIKKSIGAKRSRILQEFLAEAMLVTAFGSMVGILVGVGISWIGATILQVQLIPNFSVLIGTFWGSVLIGGVFGVYPAAKASKLDPAVALRES